MAPCSIANVELADPRARAGSAGRRRRAIRRLRLRSRSDDRARLAVITGKPGQKQTGEKKADRQNRGRARQQIGRAPARHETSAAADTEAAAFGFLQQHGGDQSRHDHQMDYNNNSLHIDLPSQAEAAGLPFWPAGFELAGCYTITPSIVTPEPPRSS